MKPDLKVLNNATIVITGTNGMLGGAIFERIRKLIMSEEIHPAHVIKLARIDLNRNGNMQIIKNSRVTAMSYENFEKNGDEFDYLFHCASPSNITKIKSYEEIEDINAGFLQRNSKRFRKRIVYISVSYTHLTLPTNREV